MFKRRKPHQSNIIELETLQKVYDYIRMLDADGYPKAYLENKFLKFEFNDANFKNKNEIIATVKIKITNTFVQRIAQLILNFIEFALFYRCKDIVSQQLYFIMLLNFFCEFVEPS